jgi:hypothetical protein
MDMWAFVGLLLIVFGIVMLQLSILIRLGSIQLQLIIMAGKVYNLQNRVEHIIEKIGLG